jgi:uncharacterized phage protein (TIGR02218 family)
MKTATTALKNLLFGSEGYVYADLYTFTLPAGGPVQRWTGSDLPVTWGGFTYAAAPSLSDGGAHQSLGLSVDTLTISAAADSRHTVGGIAFITFVKRNGLDGASVKVERIFAPAWGAAITGSMIRFAGRFSEAQNAGANTIDLIITSWLELLDTSMPADVYQASCSNTLFDAKCTVDRASRTATGALATGNTTTVLKSALTTTAGTYNLGSILMTSGICSGQRRTIKNQLADGTLTLVYPLPAVPAATDTYQAFPGCDLQQSTCSTKFANLINFRGQPFIPVPETAI